MNQTIEHLAEALMFVDATDLKGLSSIHDLFDELSKKSDGLSDQSVTQAVSSSKDLIEKIILHEADDASAALDVVRQAVSSLQAIITEGRPAAKVGFPSALNLSGQQADTADQENLSSGDDQTARLVLPENVDEEIFGDFLSRQPANLAEIESFILALEHPESEDELAGLLRGLHTLKGEAGFLGLDDVVRLCHQAEDVIGKSDPSTLVDTLLEVKDWLARTFAAYSGQGPSPEPVDQILSTLDPDNQQAEPNADGTQGDTQAPSVQATVDPAPATPLENERYPLTADKELIAEFIEEANEHLEVADVNLLKIESAPDNNDAINATFRAFHTIKGVAGFLALTDIQSLAHEAESLLDDARMGKVVLQNCALDVTFDAVDAMKTMVGVVKEALESGGLVKHDENQAKLIARIVAAKKGGLTPPANESFPPTRVMKGQKLGLILIDAGVITEEDLAKALAKQFELEKARPRLGDILVSIGSATKQQIENALASQGDIAQPKHRLGDILVNEGALSAADLALALKEQQAGPPAPAAEALVRDNAAPAKAVTQAVQEQATADKPSSAIPPKGAPEKAQSPNPAQKDKLQIKATVKVDSTRLDGLIDTIGELVIAEAMVHQAPELQGKTSETFTRLIGHLNKITRELQEMATSLRMTPIGPTFQRMARLVRDVAKKTGKSVDFSMSGEETELDKTVVDQIGDPLVHMVRNAVDHGIEPTVEDRRKAGKPDAGMVTLRAFHKGGSIYIELIDDGRGLDKERILEKAIERGLVREGDALSDSEIYNLVFEPGFSTAATVSDVSGRGVGMDVVKRNIAALRGHVEIHSEPGQGSVFSIRLPLTLAIIEGMIVRVGSRRYVLPLLSITRMLRPDPDAIRTVFEKAEMLSLPDGLIPLIRLHEVFDVHDAQTDPQSAAVVVVERDGRRAGLMIDELIGQQQIVIKSLGNTFKGAPGIAGGAIMPDGLVGVIVDLDGLIKLAETDHPPRRIAAA